MLALQTDMSIPDDVSHVRIIVLKNGGIRFDQKYRVGPEGEEIPATLGVIASDNPDDVTEVRVLSYQASTVRTLNRVVTTIPRDRVATLRIPIQWLCDGQVAPTPGIPDSFDSTCPNPDEACIAGECRKVQISSKTLPDFRIEDVTGGAADATQGVCFDAAPCLAAGMDVTPDANCIISVPARSISQKVNVGVRVAPGQPGICGGTENDCYIPLDRSDNAGWRWIDENGASPRIQLPKAVCSRLESGTARAVRLSTSCSTKTEANPTCGPWTSVGTKNPTGKPAGSGGQSTVGTGGRSSTDAGGSALGGSPPGDGSGGTSGGTSEPTQCAGLLNPSMEGPISMDADVDRLGRLALEVGREVDRLRTDVGMSCVGIHERLGGASVPFAGPVPTGAELQKTCAEARLIFTERRGQARVRFGSGYCRADVEEQSTLEAACPETSGCNFGSLAERCVPRLASCEAPCATECMPSETMLSISCDGSCNGQCVGTCSGPCLRPDGSSAPDAECMGECLGTCSGSCQGNCMGSGTCEGLCRGGCESGAAVEYCEGPLELPECAVTSSCANLAAATAGLRQVCSAPPVFVPGPTPPDVAPAITDNLPRLLRVSQRVHGLNRAIAYLDGASRALEGRVSEGDRSCVSEALLLVAKAATSLAEVQVITDELTRALSEAPPIDACSLTPADDSCANCVKTKCCAELEACAASPNCQEEVNCMQQCLQTEAPAICEAECAMNSRTLQPAAQQRLSCQNQTCAECTGATTACMSIAAGPFIDDFEDGDSNTSWGNFRPTNRVDFLGSLNLIRPGSGSEVALGVAGSPDPGISIDFRNCIDAVNASGVSFDAALPSATTSVVVTARLRTRSTEASELGGACTTRCGDHFLFSFSLDAGGFFHQNLNFSNFLDSSAASPDTRQIVGLDLVIYGSATDQLAIDNLSFATGRGSAE